MPEQTTDSALGWYIVARYTPEKWLELDRKRTQSGAIDAMQRIERGLLDSGVDTFRLSVSYSGRVLRDITQRPKPFSGRRVHDGEYDYDEENFQEDESIARLRVENATLTARVSDLTRQLGTAHASCASLSATCEDLKRRLHDMEDARDGWQQENEQLRRMIVQLRSGVAT